MRGKELTCQCRRRKRRGFNPWFGKIHWRRAWQPTAVFLPGESLGQRSWQVSAHRIAKSQTQLKQLSTHTVPTHTPCSKMCLSLKGIFWLYSCCAWVCWSLSCVQLCDTMDCSPLGSFFFSWDTLGKNPRVGCHFLLQIFPTQVSNLGLLHCRQTLDRLSCQGSSLFLLSGSISLSSLSSPHSCLLIAQSLQFLKTELRTSLLKCA